MGILNGGSRTSLMLLLGFSSRKSAACAAASAPLGSPSLLSRFLDQDACSYVPSPNWAMRSSRAICGLLRRSSIYDDLSGGAAGGDNQGRGRGTGARLAHGQGAGDAIHGRLSSTKESDPVSCIGT